MFITLTLCAAASFEQNNCLEAALSLLEALNKDFNIQQEDYNSVHASLRDLVSLYFALHFHSSDYSLFVPPLIEYFPLLLLCVSTRYDHAETEEHQIPKTLQNCNVTNVLCVFRLW